MRQHKMFIFKEQNVYRDCLSSIKKFATDFLHGMMCKAKLLSKKDEKNCTRNDQVKE